MANTKIRTEQIDFSNGIDTTGCYAYQTATQSIAYNTYTILQLGSELFDSGGNFNTGTYTYTVPENGIYLASFGVYWTNIATLRSYYAGIYINSSAQLLTRDYTTGTTVRFTQAGSGIYSFTAGQTVKLFAYHNNASAEDVSAGATTRLAIKKLN